MEANGRHLSRQVCRLVLGPRRGLLRRGRDARSTTDGVRLGPQGTPVEWVEEESYFFRLSAYQDRLLELYEEQPISCARRSAATRSSSFVKRGLQDLSISRTTFDWGIPVPARRRRQQAHHVCLGRRADQLHHRRRLSGYRRAQFTPLWPADLHVIGKDIIALPCGLLAGLPDVGRHRRAEARLQPRLPVQPRGEDVEVGRQRRRSRSRWPTPTASTSCAISCCAKCRSARTATTATRRSSTASMPTSPTISAIWRSARCR